MILYFFNPLALAYFLTFFLFYNFNSMFSFWILLEFNIVFFSLLYASYFFSSSFSHDSSSNLIFYFLIQSLGSFLFLVSFMFDVSLMSFETSNNFIMLSAITMKLGVYPFQFWMYQVSEFCTFSFFFFLVTFQKIPFYIFMYSFFDFFIFMLVLVNLIVGSFMMLISYTFRNLMVSSSLYGVYWFIFFFFMSSMMFLVFFINYCVFSYFLILCSFSNMNLKFGYILSMIFIFGLPPFSFFFFKIYILSFILSNFGLFMFSLLWFFSFTSFVGYFKFFFKHMLMFSSLYKFVFFDSNFFIFFIFFAIVLVMLP